MAPAACRTACPSSLAVARRAGPTSKRCSSRRRRRPTFRRSPTRSGAFDAPSLILAASAATATLLCLAFFLRGFLAEGADPTFMRSVGAPGWLLHLLLTMLVAVNLVAGYRAFGALMTIGLMMIPAAASRFWARGYVGQAAVAVVISAVQVKPGRTSGICPSICTVTLKLVAVRVVPVPVVWIGLLPISVTLPMNVLSEYFIEE